MKNLDYYVYRKVFKFRESILEDDDSNPDPEAVKLFTDPFSEEK